MIVSFEPSAPLYHVNDFTALYKFILHYITINVTKSIVLDMQLVFVKITATRKLMKQRVT